MGGGLRIDFEHPGLRHGAVWRDQTRLASIESVEGRSVLARLSGLRSGFDTQDAQDVVRLLTDLAGDRELALDTRSALIRWEARHQGFTGPMRHPLVRDPLQNHADAGAATMPRWDALAADVAALVPGVTAVGRGYGGTKALEATAEMFTLWWCSAPADTSPAVSFFGSVITDLLKIG